MKRKGGREGGREGRRVMFDVWRGEGWVWVEGSSAEVVSQSIK